MRHTAVKLPGLSQAVSDIIVHFASVFLLAFGSQLVAGASGVVNMPTLLALLTSSAAAGVIAVGHILLGFIPTAQPAPGMTALVISVKVQRASRQFLVSLVVTFVTLIGAELVAGAAHLTSYPSVQALGVALITAAVAGIVELAVGLVPTPTSAWAGWNRIQESRHG